MRARLAAVVAAGVALTAGATGDARAATTRAAARAEVSLDPVKGRLEGVVVLAVVNPTADPIDRAWVWLYPNRLATRPAALDDVSYQWIYPEAFDPGWMKLGAAKQRGPAGAWRAVEPRAAAHAVAGAGTLVEVPLAEPVPPGGVVKLWLKFAAHVPDRWGGFGCHAGECTLLGGWMPMLAAIDEAGWDLEAPPARSRIDGTLRLSRVSDVVAGGTLHPRTRELPIFAEAAAYVPLRVSRGLHGREIEHLGVRLLAFSQTPVPPADDATRVTLAYTEEDYAAMTLRAAAEALDLLAEIGAPLPEGTKLVFVEAPSYLELATAHPGVIVVSDRLFRIFPAKKFRKYHARALVHAVFVAALAGRTAPGAGARDAGVDEEAAAAYLVDLFTVREYKKAEFAQVMLAPVSFVPAIDELLYAPQVAFAGAYFGAIADDDPFRDDVRRFNHLRPRGAVYYEKLRDLLEPEAFGDVMRLVVLGEAHLRDAAETVSGESLGWFFQQWGGRYPRVDYSLAGHTVEPAADGSGWVHRVVIEKRGIGGDQAPIEPVEVGAIDGAGKKHLLEWDGRGEEGVVEIESESRSLKVVALDPRRRLVEKTAWDDPDDPRYDDRWPPKWKFVYNQLGVAAASDGSLAVAADFSFRRVHDNRNNFRLQVFNTEAVLFGGALIYSRRFGPKIAPNRPMNSASVGLTLSRLDADFSDYAGTRLTLSAGLGQSNRLTVFEPRRAAGWGAGARVTVTRFDDDPAAGPRAGELLVTGAVSAEAVKVFTPRDGHTFWADASAALVFGDIEARSQLLGLAGAGLLRGYGPFELFGRARATGHLEWRGTVAHDLNWNLGHWVWLRSVALGAFLDTGLLSSCDSYTDLLSPDSFYAGAGFGVRFFYDDFGVQGAMLSLDVGMPLVTRPRGCLGEPAELPSRPPVFVYLTFLPVF